MYTINTYIDTHSSHTTTSITTVALQFIRLLAEILSPPKEKGLKTHSSRVLLSENVLSINYTLMGNSYNRKLWRKITIMN